MLADVALSLFKDLIELDREKYKTVHVNETRNTDKTMYESF